MEISAGLHVKNVLNLARITLIVYSFLEDCHKVYLECKDMCNTTAVGRLLHGRVAQQVLWLKCPLTCCDSSFSAVFQTRLIYTHTTPSTTATLYAVGFLVSLKVSETGGKLAF